MVVVGGVFSFSISVWGVLAVAVCAALCVGATAILNRRRTRRIRVVTDIAHKLALGDLSQRLPAATTGAKDEYGELGQAFNTMAEKLQEVYRGLEQKVAQKTTQLAQKVQEVEAERVKDEAILSSIGEGMVAVGPDGSVLKINQPAMHMLGVKEESARGRKIAELMAFLDEKEQKIAGDKLPGVIALRYGQKTEDLYVIHDEDGNKKILSIIASPVRLNQTTIGGIMILRDVTREREVDRMKTEFISLASHQLRTPLSAIRWFTEMLLSGDAGDLTPGQHEFVQNAYDSTERMIQLVNSLLNISRIESGRIIIDPQPTDLGELVQGIVNDLKGKTAEKNQSLVVSIHQGLPKVSLDTRLIGQVYLNLLTNAIKYTPKGGEISVFISTKGADLISQVTDNGYGIPKSDQAKLFQKFFRAGNAVKVETDGTGLGLYLIKSIVESSGGRIWFKSEEGKGSTFWFTIPMTGMKAKKGEVTLDG